MTTPACISRRLSPRPAPEARQADNEIVIDPAFASPERPVKNAHVVAKAVQILAERHRPGPQTPFR